MVGDMIHRFGNRCFAIGYTVIGRDVRRYDTQIWELISGDTYIEMARDTIYRDRN